MTEHWNDEKCMAKLKNGFSKCKNRNYNKTDFCLVHNKTKSVYEENYINEKKNNLTDEIKNKIIEKYLDVVVEQFERKYEEFSNELDVNYNYVLMGINDTWIEVPIIYRFYLDNLWWDIRTLIKTFTIQLNQSELSNPYPMYPENPFNRNRISVNELLQFKQQMDLIKNIDNNIKIHVSLGTFLNFSEKILSKIRNEKDQYKLSTNIIKEFNNYLRYKMINNKDSQGRFSGCWVSRKTPLTPFETCYRACLAANMIIGNTYLLLNTPTYMRNLNKLNKFKTEEVEI
jgi:hypothetical protein